MTPPTLNELAAIAEQATQDYQAALDANDYEYADALRYHSIEAWENYWVARGRRR